MNIYCLDIILDNSINLELMIPKYRLNLINDKENYPITILSQNKNQISIYFNLDKTGYIHFNIQNRIEITWNHNKICSGTIIKKYKSIIS